MRSYIYRGRRPIRDFRVVREVAPADPEIPAIPTDYASMLKADLIALGLSLGIDVSGTKADIIARLPHG